MKLVIPVHSFVDLITNSSSELFVCNTDKSVEMVKEMLVELAKAYNAKEALRPESHRYLLDINRLFDDIFQEPYISDGDETNAYDDSVGNKGDLILRSVSDNTIPYELFDDIESIFGANRYHLG